MTLNLTLAKAQELVGEVIKEKGSDTVYEKHAGSCEYVHWTREYSEEEQRYINFDPTPGCLVGQALLAGGLDFEDFRQINTLDSNAAISELERYDLVDAQDEARKYLEMIQISQDNGATWGDAERNAREEMVLKRGYQEDSRWITYEEWIRG